MSPKTQRLISHLLLNLSHKVSLSQKLPTFKYLIVPKNCAQSLGKNAEKTGPDLLATPARRRHDLDCELRAEYGMIPMVGTSKQAESFAVGNFPLHPGIMAS